jgi:flagellar protein FliO/FliZ
MLLLSNNWDNFIEFMTVLIVFVGVLALTAWTTKFIANYQKQVGNSGNIEVVESIRITNNKYIQLVRVGETYVAIAVCKDTVTTLCEIPKEQIKDFTKEAGKGKSFKEYLLSTVGKSEEVSNQTDDKE